MTTAALALVLGSAFLHAAWNALLKRERNLREATLALQALTAVAGVVLALAGPRTSLGGWRVMAWGCAAGVCEAGYFLTLAAAFGRGSLGLAYTVARGGALVLLWPISVVAFGEQVTAASIAGVVLLLAGLAATSTPSAASSGRDGLGWAALCAVCIAGYGLCYKEALSLGAMPMALFALSLSVSCPVVLVWRGRGGVAGIRRVLGERALPILVASAMCTLSFVLILYALRSAGAGAVMTLRNTSVLFALAFAAAIGERPRTRQVLGGTLVVAGAVLVGWPR